MPKIKNKNSRVFRKYINELIAGIKWASEHRDVRFPSILYQNTMASNAILEGEVNFWKLLNQSIHQRCMHRIRVNALISPGPRGMEIVSDSIINDIVFITPEFCIDDYITGAASEDYKKKILIHTLGFYSNFLNSLREDCNFLFNKYTHFAIVSYLCGQGIHSVNLKKELLWILHRGMYILRLREMAGDRCYHLMEGGSTPILPPPEAEFDYASNEGIDEINKKIKKDIKEFKVWPC